MDAAALLKRMEEQRATRVLLKDGRSVQMLRPPELELPALMHGVGVDAVVRYACSWAGFTEATLLGATQGSGDTQVPFERELWRAYVLDHADEYALAVQGLKEAVEAYLKRRAETAKNSEPSST